MIPDYQSLMLPLLRVCKDGEEHRLRDVVELLGKQLGLSDRRAGAVAPKRETNCIQQ